MFSSYGQFNYLVPTEKESILFEQVYSLEGENNYAIPIDFASPEGARGAIIFAEDGIFSEIDHANINLGLHPMVFVNDTPYLVGASVGVDTSMRIIQLTTDFKNQEKVYDFEIIGRRTINSGFLSIGDTLYVVNVNDLNDEQIVPRILQLWIINKDGQLLETKNLNENREGSYAYEIMNFNRNILIVGKSFFYDRLGAFLSLIHLDREGKEIWNFDGEEELADASTISRAAILSDSSLVVAYQVNRRNDIDFIRNDWYRKPTRLKWLDKDGVPFREKYIVGPRLQELFYYNIEKGNGDYFFAYGSKVLNEDRAAVLTKFSNTGDTIWSRNFRHADFIGLNPAYHTVVDVYEHDDQSVVVLVDIRLPGEPPTAWFFKIDENGCYDSPSCDDDILLGTKAPTQKNNSVLKIYPNPAVDWIYLPEEQVWQALEIYDVQGRSQEGKFSFNGSVVDIGQLSNGVYLLRAKDNEGTYYSTKLVIE